MWYLTGIVEEVLVEIYECFVPVDFVVLDMEVDRSTALILGQPFLRTTFAQGSRIWVSALPHGWSQKLAKPSGPEEIRDGDKGG